MAKKNIVKQLIEPPKNKLTQTLKQGGQTSTAPPANPVAPAPYVPELIRDGTTGAVVGVKGPNGEMVYGNPEKVKNYIQTWTGGYGAMAGTIEPSEKVAAQQQATTQTKQQAFLNTQQNQPVQQPLNTPVPARESIPFVGFNTAAGRQVNELAQQYIPGLANLPGMENTPIQQLQESATNEIQEQTFKKGVSFNTRLGAFIESLPTTKLPYIGSTLKSQFNTPAEVINSLDNKIPEINEQINYQADQVKLGVDPRIVEFNLANLENNIDDMEAKIKLMIIYSKEYQSKPEEINKIELQILQSRRLLLAARATTIQ